MSLVTYELKTEGESRTLLLHMLLHGGGPGRGLVHVLDVYLGGAQNKRRCALERAADASRRLPQPPKRRSSLSVLSRSNVRFGRPELATTEDVGRQRLGKDKALELADRMVVWQVARVVGERLGKEEGERAEEGECAEEGEEAGLLVRKGSQHRQVR